MYLCKTGVKDDVIIKKETNGLPIYEYNKMIDTAVMVLYIVSRQ